MTAEDYRELIRKRGEKPTPYLLGKEVGLAGDETFVNPYIWRRSKAQYTLGHKYGAFLRTRYANQDSHT